MPVKLGLSRELQFVVKIGRKAESGSRCGSVKEGRKEARKPDEPGPCGGAARRGARAAAQTLASGGRRWRRLASASRPRGQPVVWGKPEGSARGVFGAAVW